jgi:hypothetical protein
MDIPLEALTTFPYDGGVVTRGQTFYARSESDAKILVLIKHAQYQVQSVRVSPSSPAESEDMPDPPKRKYKRKDLTADPE